LALGRAFDGAGPVMALALHSIKPRQMADAIIKTASLGMTFPFIGDVS
jgi:hypothetical protein